MAKLYPPNIGGTIPAFCRDGGTVKLTVPFSMNRAVGTAEIAGFVLKMKTVNGTYIGTKTVKSGETSGASYDITEKMEVYFNVSDFKLNIGQYYKIQLAYLDIDNTVGYYSTVGVVKYTAAPQVSIKNLEFGRINTHSYQYTGVYSQQNGDASEKMYSCRFKMYDENNNIIEDSGEILHNSSKDDLRYEAHEVFTLSKDLTAEKTYYLKFFVTTNNGMEVSTPKYRLMQRRSVTPEIHADLIATLDYDNGYIKLKMKDTLDSVVSGTFLISRANSKDGYVWEEFRRFDLQSMLPDSWSLLDCTIEQGITYKYSLQQYNSNGIYSDRIISNECYADFEDAFLYDGTKQLKLRFDPKVSSFKNDLLESKVETIGSKHPFILRNGNVNYKEFPISGLISYQMDEAGLFYSKKELGIPANIYDLTSENIMAERMFKLRALEWLTDGKPKLFRSPTEGNYIVRLLNVSLSPNDSLGRMLHSFSATAYEIAKFNANSLEYYGLIDPSENLSTQTRWTTINLLELYESKYKDQNNRIIYLNDKQAYSINFADMLPGSIIYIGDESIQVGATGAYLIDSESPIDQIGIDINTMRQGGLLTYSYKTKAVNIFSTITNVEIEDVPCRQVIGTDYLDGGKDLIDYLTDTKTDILQASFGRFIKRPVLDVYIDVSESEEIDPEGFYILYKDMDCTEKINKLEPLNLYQVRYRRSDYRNFDKEGYYVDANNGIFAPYTDYFIDGNHPNGMHKITNDLFNIEIGNEVINIEEIDKYTLKDLDKYSLKIKPHLGVISELSYTRQIAIYSFEENNIDVKVKKKKYIDARNLYLRNRAGRNYGDEKADIVCRLPVEGSITGYENKVAENKKAMEFAYKEFIIALDEAILKYKKDNGLIE